MDLSKPANGIAQMGEPIPYNKPYNKHRYYYNLNNFKNNLLFL